MGRIRGYALEYARYLATPDYGSYEVHCLEITHPTFEPRYIQNRVPQTFIAIDEGGIQKSYNPMAFELTTPAVEAGTMQRLSANIDGMDGDLYIALRAMRQEDRFANPVEIVHRIYLNSFTGAPLIAPPPVYALRSAKPTATVIQIDARPKGLGDRPAGEIFTIERFPILRLQG